MGGSAQGRYTPCDEFTIEVGASESERRSIDVSALCLETSNPAILRFRCLLMLTGYIFTGQSLYSRARVTLELYALLAYVGSGVSENVCDRKCREMET
jgi:hypothetical protein